MGGGRVSLRQRNPGRGGSARRHPQGAVEADDLAVEQPVGDDMAHQVGILARPTEPGWVRHEGLKEALVSSGSPAIIGVMNTPGRSSPPGSPCPRGVPGGRGVRPTMPPLLAA